jgi:hypothetical protein
MVSVDSLDAIDAAVDGCGWCGDPLSDSPSEYWCGPDCQEAWHAIRVEELIGYREPWERPEDFPPGVVPPEALEDEVLALQPMLREALMPMRSADAIRLGEQFAAGLAEGIRAPAAPTVTSSLGLLQVSWDPGPPEFRLPRSTGDLAADWRAARIALAAAETDEQRVAVRLRMESLEERQQARNAELARQLEHVFAPMREAMAVIGEAGGVWLRQIGERMRPYFDNLRQAGVIDDPAPADPRERALAARRNRNTGPQQRRRPPRTLGRASSADRR